MKVLFVNSLYYPVVVGGAERSVQYLAEAIAAEGHEAVVVCVSRSHAVEVAMHNGVKIYYLPLKNIYWPFSKVRRFYHKVLSPLWFVLDVYNPLMSRILRRIFCAERPDLIHTNNIRGLSTAVWTEAAQLGIPVVHTLRDYYLMCPRSGMFKRGRPCAAVCRECELLSHKKRVKSRLVHAVVGNSAHILRKHLNAGYFPSASMRKVIYNGYRRESGAPLRRMSRDTLVLGYLGRLHPSKGVHWLLSSLQGMENAGVEVKVAGDGELAYVEFLKSLAGPHVKLLGKVEPSHFFSEIDVLVVPSLWEEPLPRVVFEAYAHGVPVVVSNRGGTQEIVDAGVTGFICDADDPRSLRKSIVRIMSDHELLQRMSEACLKRSEHFIPERVAIQYLEVYQHVAHAR